MSWFKRKKSSPYREGEEREAEPEERKDLLEVGRIHVTVHFRECSDTAMFIMTGWATSINGFVFKKSASDRLDEYLEMCTKRGFIDHSGKLIPMGRILELTTKHEEYAIVPEKK